MTTPLAIAPNEHDELVRPTTKYWEARRSLDPIEQERMLYGKAAGDYPAFWSRPNNRCLCPSCGEVFSGESTFDRHLAPGRHADAYAGPSCTPPEECGLGLHPHGYWMRTPSADQDIRLRALTPRSARFVGRSSLGDAEDVSEAEDAS